MIFIISISFMETYKFNTNLVKLASIWISLYILSLFEFPKGLLIFAILITIYEYSVNIWNYLVYWAWIRP